MHGRDDDGGRPPQQRHDLGAKAQGGAPLLIGHGGRVRAGGEVGPVAAEDEHVRAVGAHVVPGSGADEPRVAGGELGPGRGAGELGVGFEAFEDVRLESGEESIVCGVVWVLKVLAELGADVLEGGE